MVVGQKEKPVNFAVLGPLRITGQDGDLIALRGRHQSAVLAVLLFHANELVSMDRFVSALWDGPPPKSYVSNIHTYVARLRKRLPDLVIDYTNRCYRLRIARENVDLLTFRDAASAGRRALRAGQPVEAAAHFRRALALWRGQPLAGLPVAPLEPVIARLVEERLALVEDCAEAELAAGRHDELVAELRGLVSEHPLRERLRALLMTALYRAGRQGDALAVYREARAVTVAELGIEPGPGLRRVHDVILRGADPDDGQHTGGVGSVFPVCQLPPAIADFRGRVEEIGGLTDQLVAGRSTVPVVVVCGEPGVGKSALALCVAHAVRESFPDGQLFVQLAGASSSPREPADVLGEFLRALGVAVSAIPEELSARAASFRARLADRRVLIVLDDAAGPDQVRPLLPGTAGCAVLVTSRSRLSALAGAQGCPLAPMTDRDALGLLTGMLGAGRVGEEPDAAHRIVAACGGVPLALRVAGTRLALRSHLRLESLAQRLEIEHQRLDELAVSDLQVRASLAASYRGLRPLARRAFGFLGLLGAVDVAGWAVAVLLEVPDPDPVIEELVEANLLQQIGRDATGEPRYRLHDLLRVYAVERIRAETTEGARSAALARLFAAFLGLADTASTQARLMLTYSAAGAVAPPPLSEDLVQRLVADPLVWFGAERLNLLAGARRARAAGLHREAAQLIQLLVKFFWIRGYWSDLHDLQQAVLADAQRFDDELVEARAAALLAALRFAQGHVDGVADTYERCGEVFQRLGDDRSLACMLTDYANFLVTHGRMTESLRRLDDAGRLFQDCADTYGYAAVLGFSTMVLVMAGRLDEAASSGERALELARELGEARLLALMLSAIARVRFVAGDPAAAAGAAAEAEGWFDVVGDNAESRWYVIRVRALAEAALGHDDAAVMRFERAHALADQLGLLPVRAAAIQDLAGCRIGQSRAAEAAVMLESSLDMFRSMRHVPQQGVSLRLLALAYEVLGRPAEAAKAREDAGRLEGADDAFEAATLRALLVLAVRARPRSALRPSVVG